MPIAAILRLLATMGGWHYGTKAAVGLASKLLGKGAAARAGSAMASGLAKTPLSAPVGKALSSLTKTPLIGRFLPGDVAGLGEKVVGGLGGIGALGAGIAGSHAVESLLAGDEGGGEPDPRSIQAMAMQQAMRDAQVRAVLNQYLDSNGADTDELIGRII